MAGETVSLGIFGAPSEAAAEGDGTTAVSDTSEQVTADPIFEATTEDKIAEAAKSTGDTIPKARFDEVLGQRNDGRTEVAGLKEALAKANEGLDAATASLKTAETAHDVVKDLFEGDVSKVRFDHDFVKKIIEKAKGDDNATKWLEPILDEVQEGQSKPEEKKTVSEDTSTATDEVAQLRAEIAASTATAANHTTIADTIPGIRAGELAQLTDYIDAESQGKTLNSQEVTDLAIRYKNKYGKTPADFYGTNEDGTAKTPSTAGSGGGGKPVEASEGEAGSEGGKSKEGDRPTFKSKEELMAHRRSRVDAHLASLNA